MPDVAAFQGQPGAGDSQDPGAQGGPAPAQQGSSQQQPMQQPPMPIPQRKSWYQTASELSSDIGEVNRMVYSLQKSVFDSQGSIPQNLFPVINNVLKMIIGAAKSLEFAQQVLAKSTVNESKDIDDIYPFKTKEYTIDQTSEGAIDCYNIREVGGSSYPVVIVHDKDNNKWSCPTANEESVDAYINAIRYWKFQNSPLNSIDLTLSPAGVEPTKGGDFGMPAYYHESLNEGRPRRSKFGHHPFGAMGASLLGPRYRPHGGRELRAGKPKYVVKYKDKNDNHQELNLHNKDLAELISKVMAKRKPKLYSSEGLPMSDRTIRRLIKKVDKQTPMTDKDK